MPHTRQLSFLGRSILMLFLLPQAGKKEELRNLQVGHAHLDLWRK